jgi:diadenosine tetraphosphate (Ap4A) HIT family hydrolase
VLCRPTLETPVLREARFWRAALNRNQNLLGKTIIVLRRHEEAVTALSAEEWAELQGEVAWVVARLEGAFSPDHVNYAFLQNQDRHVHLHVIPRYRGRRRCGGVEFVDPDYPNHYRVPGSDRRVDAAVLRAIQQALLGRSA